MEKKKLLLVAISVGVFLALTIGAAILFFAPKDVPTSSMAYGKPVQPVDNGINVPSPSSAASGSTTRQNSSPQPSSLDPVDLVRQPREVPGLQQAPQGASRQGDGFHISGSGGGSAKSAETLISVPKPSTAAVPDAAPAGRAVSTSVQQTAPKSAATAASKTNATAPVQQTAPKTTASAAVQTAPKSAASAAVQAAPKSAAPATVAAQTQAKPATTQTQVKPASTQTQAKPASTQTKVYNDYWVQTGAFSTIARAESVKKTLSDKGITSIIENSEVNGKTVFRVRVGPYTSQNEANYWLSLIKSISGFEDSQVRQTQSVR